MNAFDGVQTFCATTQREREEIDDRVGWWIRAHLVDVVDLVVMQSSDSTHHCLSVLVFWRHRPAVRVSCYQPPKRRLRFREPT